MATDPICGMSVDERSAELRLVRGSRTYYFCSSHCLREFAEPERELRRLRHRLLVGWPLAVAVAGLTYLAPFPQWPWAALALATVVQFYPGWPFLRGTADAVRNRNWSMDVLIAVGTTAAYGFSTAALLLPGRLPGTYFFDASSLIVTLILSGNYLEHHTRERARGVMRRLQELLPTTAAVIRDGQEVALPVTEIREGDRIRVRPGDRFPTDGRVLEGRSSASEAELTGEALPVPKAPGASVVAGAVNGEGLLLVEASRVGQDTLLAQIGQLVAEAETSRVPLQQLADRIAALFVPVVLGLAVVATAGWELAGVGLEIGLLIFVSVVITACPCAFGIATPAAIVVGTGRAAEAGILFKGRDALERASRVDLVLTDKTGTLTEGTPSLTDLRPSPGISENDLLVLAAAVEIGSTHPLARAVVAAARARGLSVSEADEIRVDPGRGVRGRVRGADVEVVQPDHLLDEGRDLGRWKTEGDRLAEQGKAWSLVVRDGAIVGALGFFDQVAAGVEQAVRALHDDGIEVVMATGDHERAARTVADRIGIGQIRAGLSPAGKLELLNGLRASGKKVAYVGDGVNDAPALTAADLGIAIGKGTDVAREAGSVVLLRSRFDGVALALRVGRRTVRKVRGNLLWALGYNAVLLPLAMGALVPLWGFGVYQFLPITGAAAMGLSSTTVVLNSLSLRWVSLE